MNTPIKISFALGVSLLSGLFSVVHAAAKNDNMIVSAYVVATCTIQGSSLHFGNYQSKLPDQAGNVSVNCSQGTTYTVALEGGTVDSAVSHALSDPANAQLSYELYQDSARTKTWGNANTSELVSNIGNGVLQNIPVYGRIPAGQGRAAGIYADVVSVTLSY
ncbi:MAG TPA: spore coat U domain-containing protein [Herbaspirillum sp.]|jgi:spore coat protein U-like protein